VVVVQAEQAESMTLSLSLGELEGICTNLNQRHRNAQLAGRASIEYYVGQALKKASSSSSSSSSAFASEQQQQQQYDGYIMRVFSNGVVVYVPRFGIEGVLRVEDIERVMQQQQQQQPQRQQHSAQASGGGGGGGGSTKSRKGQVRQQQQQHQQEAEGAKEAAAADAGSSSSSSQFSPDEYTLTVYGRQLEMFGKVTVTVRVVDDETATGGAGRKGSGGRGGSGKKVVMELVP
jgi:hypothetical protein